MSTITHLTTLSQLDKILSSSKDKLSVIDFHASWCGPCHAIAPTFDALSKQYKTVNFLKVDVDAAQEIAGKYKVAAMPTFIFLKGTTKVDQVRGADKSGLENTIKKHASPSSSAAPAFSGKGQTLGGTPVAPDLVGEAKGVLGPIAQVWSETDPQFKVFLGLGALYFLFWYMG